MTATAPNPPAGMTRGLTLLFAVAGGAAVGNLYWAQPLLEDIAASLHISGGSASLLVTLTQVGYAAGVFLVAPLGDTLNRRRLIPAIMVISAAALACAAVAPTFATLLIALAVVGFTTVTGQLLTPLAGDLARDDQRGQVVGTVASGLLIGILVSRTISGFVADAFGWRGIYVAAAVLTLILALLLVRLLPVVPVRDKVPYGRLLLSVLGTVKDYPAVRVTLILGSAAMGVFTLFWTGLTFLLTAAPFNYSVTQIGLVGLIGLAGALTAQRAGRLHDRGLSIPATGAGLVLTIIALVISGLGATNIVVILIAVLLLDIAIQAVNVLNQTRLLSLNPQARSRLNTSFVVANFIGAAIGSALAGILWGAGGWSAVMIGGAVVMGFAAVVWVVKRDALRPVSGADS